MDMGFKFYCWMKVCPALPPKVTADSKVPPRMVCADPPSEVTEAAWTGIQNWWNGPEKITWAIHYGEAFSDEGKAKLWIADKKQGGGVAWLQEKNLEAVSYSLACFEIKLK